MAWQQPGARCGRAASDGNAGCLIEDLVSALVPGQNRGFDVYRELSQDLRGRDGHEYVRLLAFCGAQALTLVGELDREPVTKKSASRLTAPLPATLYERWLAWAYVLDLDAAARRKPR